MYARRLTRPQSAPTRGVQEDYVQAKPREWVQDLAEQDFGLAALLLPE